LPIDSSTGSSVSTRSVGPQPRAEKQKPKTMKRRTSALDYKWRAAFENRENPLSGRGALR